MKGKKKNKRKVGKIILLGMSFLLTIVLTFTITLAWFYDSDWASNVVTMAGSVGIEVRDQGATSATSGSGALHFNISTDLAYPGQAIDVSASAYNNGGTSKTNGKEGSPCYLRASFTVYTNIGLDDESTTDIDEAALESAMNSRALYDYLLNLIQTQNNLGTTNYEWIYYSNESAGNGQELSPSGTGTGDHMWYYEGVAYTDQDKVTEAIGDNKKGYFYLCYKSTAEDTIYKKDNTADTPSTTTPKAEADNGNKGILMPLPVEETAVFLWNSTFIIPWTLTNYSADKDIFVVVDFQAIQTFIPTIEGGIISNIANNQLSAEKCYYYSKSVQTVFNSSGFDAPSLEIRVDRDVDGNGVIDANDKINFGSSSEYAPISMPTNTGTGTYPNNTSNHPSPTT